MVYQYQSPSINPFRTGPKSTRLGVSDVTHLVVRRRTTNLRDGDRRAARDYELQAEKYFPGQFRAAWSPHPDWKPWMAHGKGA